jgi:hypothetical protein
VLTDCATIPKMALKTPRDPTTAETTIALLSHVAIVLVLLPHPAAAMLRAVAVVFRLYIVEEMHVCLYRCCTPAILRRDLLPCMR